MTTETFEKLATIHGTINNFFSRLSAVNSLTEQEGLAVLKEANSICSQFNGAYGEYQYLFDAVSSNFQDRYSDFWDRIEKKGEYSNEN